MSDLATDAGRILVGTCSWTDATLIKQTDWYPKRSMNAAERLAFYSSHYPIVEADSTYYFPPSPELTRSWVEHTPDHFTFNVKAYSLLTGHPTRPQSLWPDIRDEIKAEFVGKRNAYRDHLPPEAVDEVWRRFTYGLEPLRAAGKLGAVLFQYPAWFTPKRANRDELAQLRARLDSDHVCVEFRSPRWLADDELQRTLDVLSAYHVALVVVDAPPVSGLTTTAVATVPDLAVVRFHGRSDETWNARTTTAAERFRYRYSTAELREWVPRLTRLAEEADEVHALMNNCYQDYGVTNATELQSLLHAPH